ncbi:MAG TPA: hypothetical protein VI756_12135 [Blastocatellia bacterium]
MNKHFPLVIVTLFLIVGSVSAQQPSDRDRLGLHGRVKNVLRETIWYSEKDGQWVAGARQLAAERSFSPNGLMTRDITYQPDGSWDERTKESADQSLTVIHNSDGSITGKMIVTTGPDGQITTQTIYNSDGTVRDQGTWDYDANGNLLETSFKSGDGSSIMKLVPSYSNSGSLAGYTTYDSKGDVTSSVKNVSGFDQDQIKAALADTSRGTPNQTVNIDSMTAEGKMTEAVHYGGDGSVYSRTFLRYDLAGNWHETITYDGKGTIMGWTRQTQEHDADGNLIKSVVEKWDGKGKAGHLVPQSITYWTIKMY